MIQRRPAPELPGWLATQVPSDRYLVEVADGIEIHVMEHGEGRPVILFHGNPTWGYLYRRVVAELEGQPFRLIMPDLVGLGFSTRVSGSSFNLANHARWMGGLVGALGVDDAIAVVQDWGGPIGLGALSHHDGLMSGLVVMNTSIGPPRPGFRPTMFHRAFSSAALGGLAGRFGLIERNLALAQHDRKSMAGEVRNAYLYPLRLLGNDAVVDFVRMVPNSLEHPSIPALTDVAEFVAGYRGPAAIVWGDNDPILGKLKRRVARALPQAAVTSTEAGHFVQEEAPAEIAAAIRRV